MSDYFPAPGVGHRLESDDARIVRRLFVVRRSAGGSVTHGSSSTELQDVIAVEVVDKSRWAGGEG